MPIKVQSNLPAIKVLESENIFVMPNEVALKQDIRPLKILILNLMPTKIATETQLLRLLGNSPLQVDIELLQMATHTSKNTSPHHLTTFYKTFDQVKHDYFDGLIITPDAWTEELLDTLQKSGIPVVSLRRRPPQSSGVPFVDNDHYKSAMEMMAYLTELGHTKIAHIMLPTCIGEIRREGYRDFCRIRGIEARDVKIDLPANKLDQARQNGYEAMREILTKYPDTTAVFAGTDQLAIGAMICLRERGLSVPGDISITGANDMDYSSLPWFDLTTISLNRTEMGRAAAQMLLDIIENRRPHPENLLLGSTIVVRGSAARLTGGSAEGDKDG